MIKAFFSAARRSRLLVAALCVLIGGCVSGPRVSPEDRISLPSTGLGPHLEAFFEAFNSGERQKLESFVENHYQQGIDVAAEARRWARWRTVYGPLRPVRLGVDEPTRLRVFARGVVTGAWVELTARRSADEPGRLRTIAVGSGLMPDAVASGPKSVDDLVDAIRKYVESVGEQGYFSGTVLVARDSVVLTEHAVGEADRSDDRLNRKDTRFNIASITKLFTAVAVLQLSERGLISLDDSAANLLPDYPGPLDERITIRQLLTHTSGMGRGQLDAPIFPSGPRTAQDWLPLTVAEPEFEPGEIASYSNSGYVVLGAIVERLSGLSYEAYLQRNIYGRSSMTGSGSFGVGELPPNTAIPYTRGRPLDDRNALIFEYGPSRDATGMNGSIGSPAGLTYATAPDLHNFIVSVVDGTLLEPETRNAFLSEQVRIPSEPGSSVSFGYGFGWETRKGDILRLSKDGGSWGISGRLAYYPESGFVVIVLSNLDSAGIVVADRVGEWVEHLLRWQRSSEHTKGQ
ncbi:MAG: beta-lactamase family protein [Xanthomonadales bacterium]|nr:beta-lactamase family protein [Xanthomonadales bacterium]